VVDASVGVKCLRSGEELSDQARALLSTPGGIGRRVAPDLFDLECSSALLKAQRRGHISSAELAEALALLEGLPLARWPVRPLVSHAATLAARAHFTVYDAVYVVLAIALAVPLVTADERLVRALHGLPEVCALTLADLDR
jgi:predicted nucleic acid-binding protein